jgi:hypothetical protein
MQGPAAVDENSVAMNAERAVARGKAAGLDFVLRELDLGMVYLRMASNADTKSAQKRHAKKATGAYQAALYHVQSLTLNAEERAEFNDKEQRLKSLLE